MDTRYYDQLITDLKTDYRPQREWGEGRGLYLVVGHFLVGVAAGAWLLGLLAESRESLWTALLLAAGGGLAHLVFLGHPERFWRMALRVRSSWIARGFWGLSLFLPGAFLVLAEPLHRLAGLAAAGHLLAGIGTLVLIGYMGFVYTSSRAIPFWGSALHPVLYVAYALRGGCAVLLAAVALGGGEAGTALLGGWLAVTLVVAALWGYELYHAAHGDAAARRSVHEVLAGRASTAFYGGILVVGILVPAVLLSGVASLSPATLVGVALTSVAGDFFMKFTAIRAGVYRPVYP